MDARQHTLPESGFYRLSQIIGDPKASPPIKGIIPVSKATWFKWQAESKAPMPIKIGNRISLYPVAAIRDLVESIERSAA